MGKSTCHYQKELKEAMVLLREMASEELQDPLTGKGKYAKLTRWMNLRLHLLGEPPVSDQSVANWWEGSIGPIGLDDRSARKLGRLFGFSAREAAPAFKLYLAGCKFVLACSSQGNHFLDLGLLLRWVGTAPEECLHKLQEGISKRLCKEGVSSTMCWSFLRRVFEDEDDFLRLLPIVTQRDRQRYQAVYRGETSPSDQEREIISRAVEQQTGTSVEELDDCLSR